MPLRQHRSQMALATSWLLSQRMLRWFLSPQLADGYFAVVVLLGQPVFLVVGGVRLRGAAHRTAPTGR